MRIIYCGRNTRQISARADKLRRGLRPSSLPPRPSPDLTVPCQLPLSLEVCQLTCMEYAPLQEILGTCGRSTMCGLVHTEYQIEKEKVVRSGSGDNRKMSAKSVALSLVGRPVGRSYGRGDGHIRQCWHQYRPKP